MRYRAYLDDSLFFDTALSDDAVCLTAAEIELTAGGAGSFTFSVPPCNTAYGTFKKLSSVVSVLRDEEEIFYGRVYSVSGEFNTVQTIVCEGYLAVLNDSIIAPFTHTSDMAGLVSAFVDAHNAHCPSFPLTLGNIEVEDDYVYRVYAEYETAWTRLSDLVDSYGGYLAARHDTEAGIVYLDWIEEFTTSLNQTIDFGSNLIDLVQESNADGVITALIPFGATETDDDGNETTVNIASVTDDGVDYIYDADAVAEFGWVWGTKTWESVQYPANLLIKAREYLSEVSTSKVTITVTAVDLSMINESVESFAVGCYYKVTSEPHGIEDESFFCTDLELNLLNPSSDRLTLGSTKSGYVSQANAEARSNRLALENIIANYATNAAVTSLKTLVVQNTSLIEQTAEEIALTVGSWTAEIAGTDEDGNTVTIAEYISNLSVTAEEIKLAVQANADAIEEIASITIDASAIRLQASAISWESTYSSMTEDGTLTCENAILNSVTVYGTVISENEGLIVSLTSGMLQFYYDGSYYGGVSSTYWYEDSSYRGIRLTCAESASFIAFMRGDSSMETVSPAYLINFGLNPDDISQQHIFYGTAYFSGAATFGAATYMQSNIVFSNSYGVRVCPSGSTTSYRVLYMSTSDEVYVGNSSYDTYIQGSTLYLGSIAYETYLLGSSVTVSGDITVRGAITVSSAVTCSSTLSVAAAATLSSTLSVASLATFGSSVRLPYASGLQWSVSSGSSTYTTYIYFGTYSSTATLVVGSASYPTRILGNALSVGSTSAPTYLYGSSIYVSSAVSFSSTITMDNDVYFYWKDSAGTSDSYMGLSGNYFNIGNGGYETYIYGSTIYIGASNIETYIYGSYVYSNYIYLLNNDGIYSANSSGRYYRILYMNSSNVVYVGSTSYQTYIYGSTIYVGTAATTGNIYIGYNSAVPYIYIGYSSSQYVKLSGTVTVNGSSVSSDRRLKCDIEPLDDLYLRALDELRPTAYCLRDAPGKRHAGFIAQEVLEVLTDLGAENILVGDDGEGYYTLDYNAFIPILVAGYQKLKHRVEQLEGARS